jgi:signal transduction histidine kinase
MTPAAGARAATRLASHVVARRPCRAGSLGTIERSPVRVDAKQLELAVLDLALNARDAMRGGGKLMVSAEEAGNAEAADPSRSPGDYVRIKIVDSAPSTRTAVELWLPRDSGYPSRGRGSES